MCELSVLLEPEDSPEGGKWVMVPPLLGGESESQGSRETYPG